MPKKLKASISGAEIVKFLKSFGFNLDRQKGSHIILKRLENGKKEVLIIPNHKVVLKGTLRGILSQSTQYISLKDLEGFFYNE